MAQKSKAKKSTNGVSAKDSIKTKLISIMFLVAAVPLAGSANGLKEIAEKLNEEMKFFKS